MARKKTAIKIDGNALKELLLEREEKLGPISDRMGITRQTVSTWFSSNEISPKLLSGLTKNYSFSVGDLRKIREPERVHLLYRTLRNKSVPDTTHQKVLNAAKEVLVLFKLEVPIKKRMVTTSLKTKDISAIAEHIRNELELPREAITLEQLISSLEAINIPVIFMPFDSELAEADIHAFTVAEDGVSLIFIDSNCPVEDVMWRIFHEVTHIFSDHKDTVTAEEEVLCNDVATEILTPKRFFQENKKIIKTEIASKHLKGLPALVDQIKTYLGASFQGVTLALQKSRILEKESKEIKYLYGVIHTRKASIRKIAQHLSPPNENVVSFWCNIFEDATDVKLFKYQYLVRNGLMAGRVSLRRAAEVFGIDEKQMSDLHLRWTSQNEATPAHRSLRSN